MTKKNILTVILAFLCATSQPIAAKSSFGKTVSNLVNQLFSASIVVGGTYFAWMFWDTSSREQQVKTDKLYLRNLTAKLINVPIGSWYEDNSIGCVDVTRNRFWINWRIQQDPMGRETKWETATILKAAGVDTVTNQLLADLQAGRITCRGYGLSDAERLHLNRNNRGLPLAYYDIAVELKALKVHLSKFLRGIVKYTKNEYLRAGGLEGHVKLVGQRVKPGLSGSVVYLNECSSDEINQIGTAYRERLPIDTDSFWYEQELKNCKWAISCYWQILNRYVRLYTLKQLLASRVPVGQRREPSETLFTSRTAIPPYGFVRKDWSFSQRSAAANRNRGTQRQQRQTWE